MNKGDAALNAICPYFTMFPLEFPEKVINNYHVEGTAVLDPFCGRGTTLFAAREKGISSVGIDSSPVAVAAACSKLVNTTPEKIVKVATGILKTHIASELPFGEFWSWAFRPDTLLALCKLREALIKSCSTPERQALRAIILGALHGPLSKTGSSYFSNQCPRTYSPKPKYAVKYWQEHNLKPPQVDVTEIISKRANHYYALLDSIGDGFVLQGDSTRKVNYKRITTRLGHMNKQIGLIITSPPYYGMRTYIADQWLRNWFVGGPPFVVYNGSSQISHNSTEIFSEELRKVWNNCASISLPGARMVIRFGAINDRAINPEMIIRHTLENTPWQIICIENSGVPSKKSRQVNSFSGKNTPREQIEEIDVTARLNI